MLIERMDEQVKQLTKAYREELNEIEVRILCCLKMDMSWNSPSFN